jgi:hypothetical protein
VAVLSQQRLVGSMLSRHFGDSPPRGNRSLELQLHQPLWLHAAPRRSAAEGRLVQANAPFLEYCLACAAPGLWVVRAPRCAGGASAEPPSACSKVFRNCSPGHHTAFRARSSGACCLMFDLTAIYSRGIWVYRAWRVGAASLHEGTLGTWYSEQSELAEAATSPHARNTTSQLARAVFQSIMGPHEGAFSAVPAAGDHPRGGWGG